VLDDATLIYRYTTERSENAFAALVRRHADFVFSVALRQVQGDFARAQDVSQEVFIALARKAPLLRGRSSIAGWLHLAVGHAAANLKRAEDRRQRREREAHAMNELSTPEVRPEDWKKIEPALNQLVNELRPMDREALLLRFYQQRSLQEIANLLRLTDNAVRLRIERALVRLRAEGTSFGKLRRTSSAQ
jgi:RNA polymerase sigma factor (sigma-70 family)